MYDYHVERIVTAIDRLTNAVLALNPSASSKFTQEVLSAPNAPVKMTAVHLAPELDTKAQVACTQPDTKGFYTFDEVLRQLNIDENRLKRLVSEGEIRAFREGDWMKFKVTEIDQISGKRGRY